MNFERARPIADAVLYEGYILYPYRADSTKNHQRWTFGGVYPHAWSLATGADPWTMQTQCLVEGDADTCVEIRIRFLHPVERGVGRLRQPLREWPRASEPAFARVESLSVDDRELLAWQEAVEREVELPALRLGKGSATPVHHEFGFSAERALEPVADRGGAIRAVLVRTREALRGVAELSVEHVASDLYRLTVRIENRTELRMPTAAGRDQASLYSFASTHTLFGVHDGAFLSLTDPPEEHAVVAAQCVNEGTWPVLVGKPGAHDLLLSSPIILPDYPEIAPQSVGDLYDGTEIDEILSLRVLTMTDEEKRRAAATDPRAAALLARTEALGAEAWTNLHGALNAPADSPLRPGARVRVHPRAGGDAMDLLLAGRVAIIESVEHDFEDRAHVAVTFEDDPGRDFGTERMPGHRFFFSPEEIEVLENTSSEATA